MVADCEQVLITAAVDADVSHQLQRDDVFLKIGVLDRAECVENGSV